MKEGADKMSLKEAPDPLKACLDAEKAAKAKLSETRTSLAERQHVSKDNVAHMETVEGRLARLTEAQADMTKAKAATGVHEQRSMAKLLLEELNERIVKEVAGKAKKCYEDAVGVPNGFLRGRPGTPTRISGVCCGGDGDRKRKKYEDATSREDLLGGDVEKNFERRVLSTSKGLWRWSDVPCMLRSPMCPSRTCPKGVCLEHVFRRSLRESDTTVALAPNGSGNGVTVALAPNGSGNDACAWAFEAQPYSALAPHGSGTGAHDGAFKAQPYSVHCCLLAAAHSAAAAFAPC
jgi:hypothetical protein